MRLNTHANSAGHIQIVICCGRSTVTKSGVVNWNLLDVLSFEDYHIDIGEVD
jgi:hypothetical protein